MVVAIMPISLNMLYYTCQIVINFWIHCKECHISLIMWNYKAIHGRTLITPGIIAKS